MNATLEKTKCAWIRDPAAPIGQPALGTFTRACGVKSAPRRLLSCEGDWRCACGRVWTWRGWKREGFHETDANSTYCEDCGCRITQGCCQHGVTLPRANAPLVCNENAVD